MPVLYLQLYRACTVKQISISGLMYYCCIGDLTFNAPFPSRFAHAVMSCWSLNYGKLGRTAENWAVLVDLQQAWSIHSRTHDWFVIGNIAVPCPALAAIS